MDQFSWYSSLNKPSWAPPPWLFGPVWSILYLIIFYSFGQVFLAFFHKKINLLVVLPFFLNLIFNLAFTPIQFGLKNNLLAGLDILLVLFSLLWAIYQIYPYSRLLAYLQIPYLLWVSFATFLQLNIIYLN